MPRVFDRRICQLATGSCNHYMGLLWLANFLCTVNTMGCSPVREDNPQALASGLSYVQADRQPMV